jgi:YggT family protein
MFIISNFVLATAQVLALLLQLYTIILIVRVITTWVNADPYNPIVRFLYNATEPLLYRIRRVLPVVFGGIDFAPLLLLLAVYFLQAFLVQSLRDLALAVR